MTNVYSYFKEHLGLAPDDTTLKQVPLLSECGQDCKGVIDAAKALDHYALMASPNFHGKVIELAEEIVEILWRG